MGTAQKTKTLGQHSLCYWALKPMKFFPFWHLRHSILMCLKNCIKTHLYKQYHNPPPPPHIPVTFLLCIHVHVCVRAHVCVSACVGVVCKEHKIIVIHHFWGFMNTFLLILGSMVGSLMLVIYRAVEMIAIIAKTNSYRAYSDFLNDVTKTVSQKMPTWKFLQSPIGKHQSLFFNINHAP